MRRILLLTMVLFAFCSGLKSQILMDENFSYTVGDSLGAHGWVSFSGGATNVLSVSSVSLSFSGYALSNVGNSTLVQRTGQDAYKQFVNADTTGSVYVSFMVRVDSAGTGDYFFALLPDNSTSNYTARVYAKDTLGQVRFGIAKATNPITYTNTGYSYGQTHLLVAKFTFVSGTQNDIVNLFVIPNGSSIPGSEPSATVGPITQAIGDPANITRVALRQGTQSAAPLVVVDGIRVARSWSNIPTAVHNVSTIAEKFTLSQNYPNPFNPQTKINFTIPEAGFVTLKVYDMLGKEVAELVKGDYARGEYVTDFNALNLSSGIYMYKIDVKGINGNIFSDIRKMTLVK